LLKKRNFLTEDADQLISLLKLRWKDIYGEFDDSGRFFALQAACQTMVKHMDREKMLEFMVSEIGRLSPPTEEAYDWNSILIVSSGGSFGELVSYSLSMGGTDAFEMILDQSVSVDEDEKVHTLIERASVQPDAEKYAPVIRKRLGNARLQEFTSLINR